MDFLILKPSSLGDILHAFPAVSALLRAYPGSHADWLVCPAFADILRYLPGLRRTILFERKKLGSAASFLPAFYDLVRGLRGQRYDAVIDLQGLARSAFAGWLASARIHAGPAHPREGIASVCYSRKLQEGEKPHAVDRCNSMIADFLGRRDLDFSFRMPVVPQFEQAALQLLPEGGGPFCAVAPGARWDTKQWPASFFADSMHRLAALRPDMRFLILGSPGEKLLADDLRQRTADLSVENLCGRTSVGVLTELIRKASVLLCNDSGPMHIAAALEVPVVAVFGPTDPARTGPYSAKSSVLQASLPCISCFKRYCTEKTCQTKILPEAVAEQADLLIRKFSAADHRTD